MKKHLIITVDTEGDNSWSDGPDKLETRNAGYIQRFQVLCEKYGFIPTWLTSYEMIMDDVFVEYIRPRAHAGACEVGMHLHAWDSPPLCNPRIASPGVNLHPFVTQYDRQDIIDKITHLTDLIEQRIGIRPRSHRAGRWVVDNEYLSLLSESGYVVDCSVTPHVNWIKCINDSLAADYTHASERAGYVSFEKGGRILEVPMSIKFLHRLHALDRSLSLAGRIRSVIQFVLGSEYWFRLGISDINDMRAIIGASRAGNDPYLMFMIHSSELMPGGSPYFVDDESVEAMYNDLERLFVELSRDYAGISLGRYADSFRE